MVLSPLLKLSFMEVGGDLSLSGTQRFSQRSWCLFVVGDMFDLPSVCLSIFVILEILHMCQMIDGVV